MTCQISGSSLIAFLTPPWVIADGHPLLSEVDGLALKRYMNWARNCTEPRSIRSTYSEVPLSVSSLPSMLSIKAPLRWLVLLMDLKVFVCLLALTWFNALSTHLCQVVNSSRPFCARFSTASQFRHLSASLILSLASCRTNPRLLSWFSAEFSSVDFSEQLQLLWVLNLWFSMREYQSHCQAGWG